MATAKVPLALQTINIDLTGQSESPGIVITQSDQIQFFNSAPFPVKIQFICANGPVFSDIASVAPHTWSNPQIPKKNEITTDYKIVNLNTGASQGPYSIEVGINVQTVPAPLLIPITAGNPPANQVTVAVPQNGWIQFHPDGNYSITWTPTGVFPSVTITPTSCGPYKAQNGNQNSNASYSLNSSNLSKLVTGSGTVKIHS
jgi:hypothetical protein